MVADFFARLRGNALDLVTGHMARLSALRLLNYLRGIAS
jgi:hypothetical protein